MTHSSLLFACNNQPGYHLLYIVDLLHYCWNALDKAIPGRIIGIDPELIFTRMLSRSRDETFAARYLAFLFMLRCCFVSRRLILHAFGSSRLAADQALPYQGRNLHLHGLQSTRTGGYQARRLRSPAGLSGTSIGYSRAMVPVFASASPPGA